MMPCYIGERVGSGSGYVEKGKGFWVWRGGGVVGGIERAEEGGTLVEMMNHQLLRFKMLRRRGYRHRVNRFLQRAGWQPCRSRMTAEGERVTTECQNVESRWRSYFFSASIPTFMMPCYSGENQR